MRATIRLVRTGLPILLALAAATPTVFAGVGTPAARLELRIVPQRGNPGDAGGVIDLAGSQHDDITVIGQTRRFEIQYRLVDLVSTDAITPNGLRSLSLRLDASGPGLGAAPLRRAALSNFESHLAAGSPPASMDTSGVSPDLSTGLHHPFRDGIPMPSPNNDHPSNGVVFTQPVSITSIQPLSNVAPQQNVAGGWYGLYSFELLATNLATSGGAITLTASAVPDVTTGNRVVFWAVGESTPRFSPSAISGSATVVSLVPAPSVTGVVAGLALLGGRRRRSAR